MGDDGGELAEADSAGQDGVRAEARFVCDGEGALALCFASGEHHVESLAGQGAYDGSEPCDGPVPAGIERSGMDDDGAWVQLGTGVAQGKVGWVCWDSVFVDQAGPADAFVDSVDPFGSVVSGAAVAQDEAGLQFVDAVVTFGSGAVQVDGDIDPARLDREWLVEPGCWEKCVDSVDQFDDRFEPAGNREDDSVVWEASAEPVQCGDRNEQVAEFEGS